MATLKAAPQAEDLEQENRALFLHEDWRFVSVYSLWSALGVVACPGLSFRLFQTCEAQNTIPTGTRVKHSKDNHCVGYVVAE